MARPKRTQFERALVGPAGEHYVLFRLYQQGFLASLAPPIQPTMTVTGTRSPQSPAARSGTRELLHKLLRR